MKEKISSLLKAIQEETKILQDLTKTNISLRKALTERDNSKVQVLVENVSQFSHKITALDTQREEIWQEILTALSPQGSSFYSQVLNLPEEFGDEKTLLVESFQELKIAYIHLKTTLSSLEVYTETALEMTSMILDSVHSQEGEAYSSQGKREVRESNENRALIIDKEL